MGIMIIIYTYIYLFTGLEPNSITLFTIINKFEQYINKQQYKWIQFTNSNYQKNANKQIVYYYEQKRFKRSLGARYPCAHRKANGVIPYIVGAVEWNSRERIRPI